MKSRETLIRLRKFQVDENRRRTAQIEAMIAEFERMGADLDREIKTEQERVGIHDPSHFAYPTYAKAATQRRENLKHSVDDLKRQLDDGKATLKLRTVCSKSWTAGSRDCFGGKIVITHTLISIRNI